MNMSNEIKNNEKNHTILKLNKVKTKEKLLKNARRKEARRSKRRKRKRRSSESRRRNLD